MSGDEGNTRVSDQNESDQDGELPASLLNTPEKPRTRPTTGGKAPPGVSEIERALANLSETWKDSKGKKHEKHACLIKAERKCENAKRPIRDMIVQDMEVIRPVIHRSQTLAKSANFGDPSKTNFTRGYVVEAYIVHSRTGEVRSEGKQCVSCKKGNGPFQDCIAEEDGKCTNCIFGEKECVVQAEEPVKAKRKAGGSVQASPAKKQKGSKKKALVLSDSDDEESDSDMFGTGISQADFVQA